MSTINGNVCIFNGVPVDKVFSNGKQVYGRNMIADSGFESGKTPENYSWGDLKSTDRFLQAVGQLDTHPTPFGNYMLRMANNSIDTSIRLDQYVQYPITPVIIKKGETWTYSYYYASAGAATGAASDFLMVSKDHPIFGLSMGHDSRETSGGQTTWHHFVKTWTADRDVTVTTLRFGFVKKSAYNGWLCIDNIKLEKSSIVTPWTPAPEDVLK